MGWGGSGMTCELETAIEINLWFGFLFYSKHIFAMETSSIRIRGC